jgi:hypothetical protein
LRHEHAVPRNQLIRWMLRGHSSGVLRLPSKLKHHRQGNPAIGTRLKRLCGPP